MRNLADLRRGLQARSGDVSVLDRLEVVRRRLIFSLLAVALGTGTGFVLVTRYRVLGVLIAPIEPFLHGARLKYLSPTDPFFITLKLAILIGVLLALPYVLRSVWVVVRPLLLEEEKHLVRGALFGALALFLVGRGDSASPWWCRVMLRFTMGFQQASLEQAIVVDEYLGLVLRLLPGLRRRLRAARRHPDAHPARRGHARLPRQPPPLRHRAERGAGRAAHPARRGQPDAHGRAALRPLRGQHRRLAAGRAPPRGRVRGGSVMRRSLCLLLLALLLGAGSAWAQKGTPRGGAGARACRHAWRATAWRPTACSRRRSGRRRTAC